MHAVTIGFIQTAPFGKFACRVCGEPTAIAFCAPTAHDDFEHSRPHFQAWCERCCLSHEYEYIDRGDGWRCVYCDASPPDESYYEPEPGLWDD